MNCLTYEFKKLELPSNPELRDSHIAFNYNNKLYIWGGIIKEIVTHLNFANWQSFYFLCLFRSLMIVMFMMRTFGPK